MYCFNEVSRSLITLIIIVNLSRGSKALASIILALDKLSDLLYIHIYQINSHMGIQCHYNAAGQGAILYPSLIQSTLSPGTKFIPWWCEICGQGYKPLTNQTFGHQRKIMNIVDGKYLLNDILSVLKYRSTSLKINGNVQC